MRRRVLIAGLGKIGYGYDAALDAQYVYSHARAFAGHSAFELVGGCDPSPDARAAFSAQYGVPAWASRGCVNEAPHRVTPQRRRASVSRGYGSGSPVRLL